MSFRGERYDYIERGEPSTPRECKNGALSTPTKRREEEAVSLTIPGKKSFPPFMNMKRTDFFTGKKKGGSSFPRQREVNDSTTLGERKRSSPSTRNMKKRRK